LPGYDLRPVPGAQPERIEYGILPPRFFDALAKVDSPLSHPSADARLT
jgi:hypothetical protein